MRSKRNEKIGYGILILIPAGVIAFTLSTMLPNLGSRDQTFIIAFQLTEPQLLARQPLHGAVHLTSGFAPDPYIVRVQAGGAVSAREAFGSHCSGYIKSDPTFSLDYSSGVSELYIAVEANGRANTTLVVYAPDKSWYCDDDSGARALDPLIQFTTPSSGGYVIWVGSHEASRNANAILTISEPGK